jgi:hypothetical protein
MTKLKVSEVSAVRSRLLEAQGGRCAICLQPCAATAAVLDHDHATGAVRAVLHRGCNSLLGKLENNAARYGVRSIGTFTSGVAQYLRNHMVNITGLIHPTHRTADEKRELRNKRARVSRAKKKDTA